jgi:hypothetical protein
MIREAADDPPVYKAAQAVAFNAAIRSLGRDPSKAMSLTARIGSALGRT